MSISNVSKVAFHRNGSGGESFQVVLFDVQESGEPTRRMVAIRFRDDVIEDDYVNPRIAVLDVEMLAKGLNGASDGNAWRGDRFADELDQYFYPDDETYNADGVNTKNSFNTAPESV
jgi:hypothetical protein